MSWPEYLLIIPRLEPICLLMEKKLKKKKKDANKRELSTTKGWLVRLCHTTCWTLVVLSPMMFSFRGFAEVPVILVPGRPVCYARRAGNLETSKS